MNRLRVARLACLILIATTLTTLPLAGAAAASDPLERGRKVTWHNTSYTDADAVKITASGKLRGGKRKLQLQAKFPGGWRTFARGHSKKSGKFHVDGKLKWYGTHKVRVRAGGRKPFKRSTKVHVSPSWAPRGAASSHGFTKSRGYRYLLDPCQKIRYQVNASDIGQPGIDLAKLAMDQVAWATGLKVRYAGTTNFVPFRKKRGKPKRGIDLVIAWAPSTAIKEFQGTTVGGLGGPLLGRSGIARKGHKKVWRIQSSGVTLNTDQWVNGTQYQGWDGPTFTAGQVLLHEIGHAFGLRHVNHADQLMYPSNGLPDPDGYFRARYSAGDLAGMQKSGLAAGCVRKAFWHARTARVAPAPIPEPTPVTVRAD
ncbi:matrixin family metalloprotease [Nocardioides sp. YIM 152315]|uniref:matrixin family metalloprotease n=1 Tax=Nocardioides sp. YIM 152315 TaxID=3031760 RepID=UPI0023D99B25|nr:matrixin family metalloprotease [Nocardioides sp. YIM 152315]MDF1603236.1 matrixin family metalloprotease [Nocardioides sp. YIM 152315]